MSFMVVIGSIASKLFRDRNNRRLYSFNITKRKKCTPCHLYCL